jgi:hypothetical protein
LHDCQPDKVGRNSSGDFCGHRLAVLAEHLQQALRIKPGLTQAQNALARLQAGE